MKCNMGNKTQGSDRVANIEQGKAKCYVNLNTTPKCYMSCSAWAYISDTVTDL